MCNCGGVKKAVKKENIQVQAAAPASNVQLHTTPPPPTVQNIKKKPLYYRG